MSAILDIHNKIKTQEIVDFDLIVKFIKENFTSQDVFNVDKLIGKLHQAVLEKVYQGNQFIVSDKYIKFINKLSSVIIREDGTDDYVVYHYKCSNAKKTGVMVVYNDNSGRYVDVKKAHYTFKTKLDEVKIYSRYYRLLMRGKRLEYDLGNIFNEIGFKPLDIDETKNIKEITKLLIKKNNEVSKDKITQDRNGVYNVLGSLYTTFHLFTDDLCRFCHINDIKDIIFFVIGDECYGFDINEQVWKYYKIDYMSSVLEVE